MDPARPVARSLVVEGERIVALDEEPAGARRVDLAGGCLLPGFTDAHVHFPTWAVTRRELQLHGLPRRGARARRRGGAERAAGTLAAGVRLDGPRAFAGGAGRGERRRAGRPARARLALAVGELGGARVRGRRSRAAGRGRRPRGRRPARGGRLVVPRPLHRRLARGDGGGHARGAAGRRGPRRDRHPLQGRADRLARGVRRARAPVPGLAVAARRNGSTSAPTT